MARRGIASVFARSFTRTLKAATRSGLKVARKAAAKAAKKAARPGLRAPAAPARSAGDWTTGVAVAAAGARRYRLFRPAGVASGERLPLVVMLHGCTQDALQFAQSTRMNRLAARERFIVLYPEQERGANPQRCWNWWGTASGQAQGEATILLAAIDQVCRLQPVDRGRIALAGLSAGASMAALLAEREPAYFKALVMHSGIPPGSANSALSALGAMRGRRTASALGAGDAAAGGAAWPPLLVIHGSADPTVAPNNGRAAAEVWAQSLGAVAGPLRVLRRGQRLPMRVTDFRRAGRVVVSLCEVERLGHAWSGGDARLPFGDATGPDASRMVWAFATRQFGAAVAREKS